LKEERGHSEDGIVPFFFDGERVFRCPLTLVSSFSWEYIKAFSLYEKGFLPNSMAWGNESYKFNQAISILENSLNEARSEKIKNAHH